MSSCLGIYIEKNLIKYAKVTKEKEKVKIDSFGIKAYDDLEQTVEQIVEETFSFKIPISINLPNAQYLYSNMFALLQDKDLEKAAETEFGAIISERGGNPEALEMRKIYVPQIGEKDKLKVIYVAANKTEMNERMKWFAKSKVTGTFSSAMALPTLLEDKISQNCFIINLEEESTITKIIGERIYEVEVLEENSTDVLKSINEKENSFMKSYEACKNTTIYTSEGAAMHEYELGYLEEIMPTIFKVVERTQKALNDSEAEIKTVYLTGALAMINNMDLYFQEHLTDVKCEMLRPSFIQSVGSVNIKDYMEINTPVSLALSAMGEGIKGINFKKVSGLDKISFGAGSKKNSKSGKGDKPHKEHKVVIRNNLTEKLDAGEMALIRLAIIVIIIFITYAFASNKIITDTTEIIGSLSEVQDATNRQIASINSDITTLNGIKSEYTAKIQNIQIIEDRIADVDQTRNKIPNLLQHIMYVIPEGVQLISIENTSGSNIQIKFQSDQYEQIGYFTAKIKEDEILTDVKSTASEKSR